MRIISLSQSFHGRTLAPVAACLNPVHIEGFLVGDAGFDQVPFGDLDALRAAITDSTAGIILEPVQGEGGIRAMPVDYLQAVRRICDEHGILLMFDAVQSNADLLKAMTKQKLLAVKAGGNSVRLLPPLNITAAEVDEGLALLTAAYEELKEN